ncbi:MAG: vancomycin high temperature exclusion protein [Armatimonadota bacterium]
MVITPKNRKRIRLAGIISCALLSTVCIASVVSERIVTSAAAGRLYDATADVPARDVAVVLGTSPKVAGGRPNVLYEARIDAAAQLYTAGRVRCLLVSGDNGDLRYNEPTRMRADLIKRGIPAKDVVCDYAGFRTLDSIVRAQKVFGQDRYVIVSQPFHNERAVYLARQRGIDAVAFNAVEAPLGAGLWIRERIARFTAILDVNVFNRQPRFLGKREPMPTDADKCEVK